MGASAGNKKARHLRGEPGYRCFISPCSAAWAASGAIQLRYHHSLKGVKPGAWPIFKNPPRVFVPSFQALALTSLPASEATTDGFASFKSVVTRSISSVAIAST